MGNNSCESSINTNFRKVSNIADIDVQNTKTDKAKNNQRWDVVKKFLYILPTVNEVRQYFGVIICGLSLWGTSWFVFENAVLPGGYAFEMTVVVVMGYIFGHTLERYTTIHPVVGMTLTGVIYRNNALNNFLDHPSANAIDYHFRKLCAVVILTKGPLGWNWDYIRKNSTKVFSLATLPWIVECLTIAVVSHLWLDFPWYWGFHLGAILASVSPAIVVPITTELTSRGLGVKNQVGNLVANSGGLDTAFTEAMFGIINSAIFYPSDSTYRIIRAVLAIFMGIFLGITWGALADVLPVHSDLYAPTIRSLHILAGGLLVSYAGAYFGWGGTSGVAIMVCASTAATRWSRQGWAINDNPVSETYKLLWRILEPMLFTLSGYFFEVSKITVNEFSVMLGCIMFALMLRMLAAVLVCVANNFSVKESLFVAITWIPKAVVEAVLVRVATDSLWKDDSTNQDRHIASQHTSIIIIAILITSTLGSSLTTALGPILLKQDSKISPEDGCQDPAQSSK